MVWPCGRGREEVDYNVISRQEFIVNVGVSLGIDILDDKDKESQNALQVGRKQAMYHSFYGENCEPAAVEN